ncbi:MAG: sulfatase-like hydrolase/transferase [Campylobacter sp.]|nr:sulfatase-like hydrolase/transferase [Campylobacter sp.]
MTYISVLCFIVSFFLAKFLHKKWLLGVACVGIFVYILFMLIDFLFVKYTGNSMTYFSINFFKISIDGAPISTFMKEILLGLSVFLALILFCVIFYKKIAQKLTKNLKFSFLFLVFFIIAFVLNPTIIAIYKIYMLINPPIIVLKASIYPHLKVPMPKPATKDKNIVYIFLESFNKSYTNPQIFPNLTPYISNLTHKIEFTNISQSPGASITIEGIFSANCALPYVFNFKNADKNAFYTNIKCASEILKEQGYHTYFMKGAPLDFQKTQDFLRATKFDEMKGKEQLVKQGATNLNEWGVDDDEMFEIAWADFLRLSKSKKKFFQSILTVSTHVPNGFIPKACQNLSYEKYDIQMLRAVKCTDMLLSKFIDKIRSSEFSKNTIIVLQSDHKVPMIEESKEVGKLASLQGGLVFTILDDDIKKDIFIDTKGSSIDTMTTLLGYFGILDELNLGKNLFKFDGFYNANEPIFVSAAKLLPHIDYDEVQK